jgi:hypothetical protein
MAVLVAAVLAGGMLSGSAGAADAPATAPAATQKSTGPASALFTEVVTPYMEGKWDALDKLMKEKVRELGQLSTEEQAGIAAIRLAVKEGRPEWWEKTRTGTKGQIMPVLWGRKIPVMFDPKTRHGTNITIKNGQQALAVGWVHTDMDSAEPATETFTKGDVASLTAWANLGAVDSWSQVSNPGSQLQLDRYLEFRGKVTGMSFGTPGARRYGMWQCLASFTEENPKSQVRMARRAVATAFMSDLLTKPEAYPSIKLPDSLAAENAEGTLGLALAPVVAKQAWTFAEDSVIRQSMKQLAAGNGVKAATSQTITLPNNLKMSLDPRADEALAAERSTWIKQQFDKVKGGGK